MRFPCTRRDFLAAAGALAAARLVGAAVPSRARPPRTTLRIGLLVPDDVDVPALADARDGIALGLADAGRALALLGGAVQLEERRYRAGDLASLAEPARALVERGAVVLLAGLSSGSSAAAGAVARALGVPVMDVLETDDAARAAAGACDALVHHVAPSEAMRAAARARGGGKGDAVVAWDASLEKYGAGQVNARWQAMARRPMTEAAWCGWAAVKLAADAWLRAAEPTPAALARALRAGRFDASKGRALSFDACSGQLAQPLYVGRRLVEAMAIVLLALAGAAPLDAQRAGTPRPPRVVVSEEGGKAVALVDLATGRVERRIATGERPRGVRVVAGGRRVLVALSDAHPNVEGGGDAIVEYDLASGRIVARHRAGTDPEQFALSPDATRLYAANEDAGTASVFDLRTGKTRATLIVGIEPEGVAVSPDGRWAYVTAETSNSVSVIDTRSEQVATSFLVDVRPRGAAFSPDGSRAWVTNEISGTLSVIDARKHEVLASVELEGGTGKPVGVAVSPDGALVYVANGAASTVSVVDARTLVLVARIPVGRRPWGVALSRDGRWLVTANGVSDDVSVIDTRARREVSRVKVGGRPWGVAVLE